MSTLTDAKPGFNLSRWALEHPALTRYLMVVLMLLGGGVKPGQAIVTAGVNLLKPGQKVKILAADVARRGDAEAEASGRTAPAGGAAK